MARKSRIFLIVLCVLVLLSNVTLPKIIATDEAELYGYIHLNDGNSVTQLSYYPITIINDETEETQIVYTDEYGFYSEILYFTFAPETLTLNVSYYDPDTQIIIDGSTTIIFSQCMRADPTIDLTVHQCEWYVDNDAPVSTPPPHSDEIVIDLYYSKEFVFEGDTIEIFADIKNVGDADCNDDIIVKFYDGDASIPNGEITIDSLRARETKTVSISWEDLIAGIHKIIVKVNEIIDTIIEIIKDNNDFPGELPVLKPLEDDDSDGLSNWDEVNIYGTDPTDPDTDDDFIIDGVDPNPTIYNINSRPGNTINADTITVDEELGVSVAIDYESASTVEPTIIQKINPIPLRTSTGTYVDVITTGPEPYQAVVKIKYYEEELFPGVEEKDLIMYRYDDIWVPYYGINEATGVDIGNDYVWSISNHLTDPTVASKDTDGDGLTNFEEMYPPFASSRADSTVYEIYGSYQVAQSFTSPKDLSFTSLELKIGFYDDTMPSDLIVEIQTDNSGPSGTPLVGGTLTIPPEDVNSFTPIWVHIEFPAPLAVIMDQRYWVVLSSAESGSLNRWAWNAGINDDPELCKRSTDGGGSWFTHIYDCSFKVFGPIDNRLTYWFEAEDYKTTGADLGYDHILGPSGTPLPYGTIIIDKNSIPENEFVWIEASFSTPLLLEAEKKYWIVLKSPDSGYQYWASAMSSDDDPEYKMGSSDNGESWIQSSLSAISQESYPVFNDICYRAYTSSNVMFSASDNNMDDIAGAYFSGISQIAQSITAYYNLELSKIELRIYKENSEAEDLFIEVHPEKAEHSITIADRNTDNILEVNTDPDIMGTNVLYKYYIKARKSGNADAYIDIEAISEGTTLASSTNLLSKRYQWYQTDDFEVTDSIVLKANGFTEPIVEYDPTFSDQHWEIWGSRQVAQSFTTPKYKDSRDKELSTLEIKLSSLGYTPSDELIVEIQTDQCDNPSNIPIASATIPPSAIIGEDFWLRVVFSQPIFLSENTKYWIVLKSPDSNDPNCWYWNMDWDNKVNTGTSDQVAPSIAVDTYNSIILLYQDRRYGHWDIFCSYSNDEGNSWTTRGKVNDDNGPKDQCNPSVAVDNNRNIYVVWQDNRNGNWDIYFSKSTDGGLTFIPNIKINDDNGNADQVLPKITLDTNNGNIYVVWQDNRDEDWNIYFSKSTNGGTSFGDGIENNNDVKVNDDGTAESQRSPSIAVDTEGDICIVWDDNRNGYYDIYFSKSTNGGISFGDGIENNNDVKVNIDTLPENQNIAPSIATFANDKVYVVWKISFSGTNEVLYFSKSTDDGNTFSPYKNVYSGGLIQPIRFYSPSVDVDTSNNIFITWRDFREGDANIYFSKSVDEGITFSNNIKIHDDGGTAAQFNPSIAVGPNDYIYLVWEDYRNIEWDLYFTKSTDSGLTFGDGIENNNDIKAHDDTKNTDYNVISNDNGESWTKEIDRDMCHRIFGSRVIVDKVMLVKSSNNIVTTTTDSDDIIEFPDGGGDITVNIEVPIEDIPISIDGATINIIGNEINLGWTQESSPTTYQLVDVAITPEGNKAFAVGWLGSPQSSGQILEYNGMGWTVTYEGDVPLMGVDISEDGTKGFAVGKDLILQYSSGSWTDVGSFDIHPDIYLEDVTIKPDGSKGFAVGYTDYDCIEYNHIGRIYKYDGSSWSRVSGDDEVIIEESAELLYGIKINGDGTKAFACGKVQDYIWDEGVILEYDGFSWVKACETSHIMRDIDITLDGLMGYAVGDYENIYEYDSTSWYQIELPEADYRDYLYGVSISLSGERCYVSSGENIWYNYQGTWFKENMGFDSQAVVTTNEFGTKTFAVGVEGFITKNQRGYPKNPYLDIDGYSIWSYQGEFSSIETLHIAGKMNEYIYTHNPLGGQYEVPLIFHSNTIGKIQIANIEIYIGVEISDPFDSDSDFDDLIDGDEKKWNTCIFSDNSDEDYMLDGYEIECGGSALQDPLVYGEQFIFSLIVSFEYDVNPSDWEDIVAGWRRSSNILYDATDGWIAFGRIDFYDNSQNLDIADVRVVQTGRASAYLGAIDDWHNGPGIKLIWNSHLAKATIVHEFGHYAFWLDDEYDGICRANIGTDSASSLMEYCNSYNLLEFCTPLSHNPIDIKQNLYDNLQNCRWGESCWETIFRKYNSINGEFICTIRFDLNNDGIEDSEFPKEYIVNPGPFEDIGADLDVNVFDT